MGHVWSPWAVALAAGSLWVTDNAAHTIVRLDPATGEILATIPLEVEPFSMNANEEAVWVSALDADQVIRIDPKTNAAVATIEVPSAANFAFTDGAVWVTNLRLGTVTRIDPQTNTVTATIDPPGPGQANERPESIAVGPEGVYVMDKRAHWWIYDRDGAGGRRDVDRRLRHGHAPAARREDTRADQRSRPPSRRVWHYPRRRLDLAHDEQLSRTPGAAALRHAARSYGRRRASRMAAIAPSANSTDLLLVCYSPAVPPIDMSQRSE